MEEKKIPRIPKTRREYCKNGGAMDKEIKIRIDGATLRQLTLLARREGITRAAAARNILRAALNTEPNPPGRNASEGETE